MDMMTLECTMCNKKRELDASDGDEVHNAILEGWEFALGFEENTLCPKCNETKQLREFMERL